MPEKTHRDMTEYGAAHLRAAVCLRALVVADPGLGVVVVPVTVRVGPLAERLLLSLSNGQVFRAVKGHCEVPLAALVVTLHPREEP